MPVVWTLSLHLVNFVAAWPQNTALALAVPSVIESRMVVFDSLIVDVFLVGYKKRFKKFAKFCIIWGQGALTL